MHVRHKGSLKCVHSPHSSIASRRTHLSIGRSNSDVFDFSFTRRTNPSLPGMTSITLAIGQQLLGELSSTINTTSPTAKFLHRKFHLCRCCNKGMYSRDHRLQSWSARYCTCRYLLREKVSSFLKIPGVEPIQIEAKANGLGQEPLGLLDPETPLWWVYHL